jgi:hypothetical protein
MQELGAVAALGFERVAEGVAQVQQGPPAVAPRLELVIGDHGGFQPAAFADGVRQRRRIAGHGACAMGLAPIPERTFQQAMLGHLAPARPQLARGQGAQRRGIGQHQLRLVEGAEQILAVAVLMPVLPPTELSTCASRLVGHCTKGRPRSTEAAA